MATKSVKISAVMFVLMVVVFIMVSAVVSKEGTVSPNEARIKRGARFVLIGGCNDCHSPKAYTAQGPLPDTARILSGHPQNVKVPAIPPGVIDAAGWVALTNADFTAWAGPWGISYAANLTPDNLTGIGAWNEQVFIQAMRTGKHMGAGRGILPPMPWQAIGQLNDEELKDIFAYLKSLRPVSNQVPQPAPPVGK